MAQDLRQLGDAELARSAAAVRVRGQPDLIHCTTSLLGGPSQAQKYHAVGGSRAGTKTQKGSSSHYYVTLRSAHLVTIT